MYICIIVYTIARTPHIAHHIIMRHNMTISYGMQIRTYTDTYHRIQRIPLYQNLYPHDAIHRTSIYIFACAFACAHAHNYPYLPLHSSNYLYLYSRSQRTQEQPPTAHCTPPVSAYGMCARHTHHAYIRFVHIYPTPFLHTNICFVLTINPFMGRCGVHGEHKVYIVS